MRGTFLGIIRAVILPGKHSQLPASGSDFRWGVLVSWGQDVFLENEAPFFSVRSRSCFFAPDSNSERAKSSVFQTTTAGFQVAPLPPAPWEQNTHRHRSRRRTTMAAAPRLRVLRSQRLQRPQKLCLPPHAPPVTLSDAPALQTHSFLPPSAALADRRRQW